jgi:phage/plasmid-like protein (TIGR03299 family)
MAHELLRDDKGKACIMYVDEVPWHGLGQRHMTPPTAAEAIEAACLNWRVSKTPLFYHESIEVTGIVPGYFAVVPTEGWIKNDRPVFGVVTDQYKPLQNREAFSFFDPLVKSGKATYETAGALGEGERVWVMAKLNKTMRIGQSGNDEVQQYLLLSNSHDGKSAVQIKFTPIRVVCNNTLSMALRQGEAIKIEHTQDVNRQMELAQDIFARVSNQYERIEEDFQKMARVPVIQKQIEEYFGKIFPDPNPPQDKAVEARYEAEKKRAVRDRECCKVLFENPRNKLPGTANTVWAVYNAVTDYVDHRHAVGNNRALNPSTRLQSIWFGKGSAIKIHAFDTALTLLSNR